MSIETTYILKADEGKTLHNKITGLEASAVWLKIGDSKDDWEEIDVPILSENDNPQTDESLGD